MNKLLFFIKRPPVVLVVGKGSSLAAKTISQILEKNILIFESVLPNFFLKKSKMPILVIVQIEQRKQASQIKELVKILPEQGHLILNFDDDRARELRGPSALAMPKALRAGLANCLTYGFSKKADLRVSDVNVSPDGTNFKINYQGNIVPFWFKESLKRKHIYSILSAIAVGVIHDINLVEISQSLK